MSGTVAHDARYYTFLGGRKGFPLYGVTTIRTHLCTIYQFCRYHIFQRVGHCSWKVTFHAIPFLSALATGIELTRHPIEWVALERTFDLRQRPTPEVLEELVRITGLTINDRTHPSLILSKALAEQLEWICRQNRKTRHIVSHLSQELTALDEQDGRLFEQQNIPLEEIRILEARSDASDEDGDRRDEERYEELCATHASIEEQRARWHELRAEMEVTLNNEVVIQGNRVVKAATYLENYFVNSGIPMLDTDAYLEEMRESTPALRTYFGGLRALLAKYQRDYLANKLNDLDLENITMLGKAPHEQVPQQFQNLAAEYDYRRRDLELAQAEFDNRAETNEQNRHKWEEAHAHGHERPSREDFDLSCLQEDIRKTKALKQAEEALLRVRMQLRKHVALSDVDSFVPDHRTPIKGTLHTAGIRTAMANPRIEAWWSRLDTNAIASSTDEQLSQRSIASGIKSLAPEDSYSIVEQNKFRNARKRGWQRLQAARRIAADTAIEPRHSEAGSPGKRSRSPSESDNSDRSNGSNKRQKPLWSELAFC